METTNIMIIVMALYIVAQIIARITPTKKDDEIVGIVGKVLNIIFLKSNIKGEVYNNIESNILKEAVNNATSKNKIVSDKIEKEIGIVVKRIEDETQNNKTSIKEVLKKKQVSSTVVKKVEKIIDDKFLNFKSKSKFGNKIKNIFRR